VTSARPVVIAGAGIGGLTAAIALAQRGFRVDVLEQAEQLEAIGAGIQLSPNASRVLIGLGLREQLAPHVVAPQALKVMSGRSGRVVACASFDDAEARYGAPFWVIHRGDLHTVLRDAATAAEQITLQLGTRVEVAAVHDTGVTVGGWKKMQAVDVQGCALIGADGLWSALRGRLTHAEAPRFAGYTAWRALVPADAVSPALSEPSVNLWLGWHGHVVHYPVRGAGLINVVAIMRDDWREAGWSAPGERDHIVARFRPRRWHAALRELIGAAEQWQKWALYDCRPFKPWGTGPVTLLGDAAHPMLPYLAQGAAMAVEDAAVLAQCFAKTPDDAPAALRNYEDKRRARTRRTQIAARRNGVLYHIEDHVGATLRNLAISAVGGESLLRRYDWLYRWQPD
jgi:salicylate hydroxylase